MTIVTLEGAPGQSMQPLCEIEDNDWALMGGVPLMRICDQDHPEAVIVVEFRPHGVLTAAHSLQTPVVPIDAPDDIRLFWKRKM